MKYSSALRAISISASEWSDVACRLISGVPAAEEDETARLAHSELTAKLVEAPKPRDLRYCMMLGGVPTQLFGRLDHADGREVTLVRESTINGHRPPRELRARVRGELFTLAYIYSRKKRLRSLTVTAIYYDPRKDIHVRQREEVTSELLTAFFKRCRRKVAVFSRPERDRVMKRLPSMQKLRFPFDKVREGQGELVRTVYRSIARGSHLLAEAPTGTGKTVSVIYPAVRALGDGRCDKVFYLTPKTTIARAAMDCIEMLVDGGADIRAVRISAKDKVCPNGMLCRSGMGRCHYSAGDIGEAVLALYDSGKAVTDTDDIIRTARERGICPYELSLCYSEVADIIICDINYFFDPVVYLRRYFDTEGEFVLLVDEAHNIESRAREMYSAELAISSLDLAATSPLLASTARLKEELYRGADKLDDLFMPYLAEDIRTDENGVRVGAAHLSEIPSKMYTIVGDMISYAEEELSYCYADTDDGAKERIALIREVYYGLRRFSDAIERFDEGYRLLIFFRDGQITLRILCIDTGRVMATRLRRARSAIFFSATLEPASYYAQTIGLKERDFISVRSPFAPEALSVSIMDTISTRYSERERTLPAVAQVIAATLSARRGHYMVYAPSFEYAEALYSAFTAKYPTIRAVLQKRTMRDSEREKFLREFYDSVGSYLVGFCVMGGIYSEGIDLAGESLIGAIVVGIGMPSLSYEREAIAEYYGDKLDEGKQYAYVYPGMNKVFQAAGRVIRRESDRGVIVLIDDRFADPIYKKNIPKLWRGMRYTADAKALKNDLDAFWRSVDEEK